MDNKINYFCNINKEADNKKILFRMGYRNGITKISSADEKKINLFIKKSKSLCSLKGALTRLKIKRDKDKIILENKIIIRSKNLGNLLINSDEVVLMAATTGKDVIKERDKQIIKGDPVFGIILDATASETVDAGLDWIQDFFNVRIAKEGLKLTRRYSPGYGDLDISVQKIIYKMLKLQKLNVKITNKYILIPEKTVLAISGIIKNRK